MYRKWTKRILWLGMLVLLSLMPAHLASVGNHSHDDASTTNDGHLVMTYTILAVSFLGFILATHVIFRRHRNIF